MREPVRVSFLCPIACHLTLARRPRNFIDTTPEDILSLPRHFRDNGYLTLGLGKLWHQVRPKRPRQAAPSSRLSPRLSQQHFDILAQRVAGYGRLQRE